MDLKHELEQELKLCKFIQLSTLHRLVTKESVRAVLDSRSPELGVTDLQKIVTKAPKLFASLVLLGREGAIEQYLRKDFLDTNYPVFEKARIPDIAGVDKQDLYNRQWQIPIILPRSPHLDLPNEFIPPFLPSEGHQPRHGSFGFVYKVKVASGHLEDYESSEYVAHKQIRKDDKNEWKIMMREVETLRARGHEHIVPLLSSWTQQFIESERPAASLNLLFPYSSMTLDEWLNCSKPPRDWEDSRKGLKDYIYHSMKCLCDAVTYLHREIDGLISSHHDLKPENILLFGKDWKIADFGRTHLMRLEAGSDTEGKSGLGTFTYHPPEYWDLSGKHAGIRHGRAFDVWALGCIFVEFATIAARGWSSQALQQFKENRKINTSRSIKDFPDRRDGDDHSYHNNMNVVRDWMRQLRDSDGSSRLISVLEITDSMLSREPHDRPLSWEVYLNLDELLNPNKTNNEKEIETNDRVQRPNRRHPKMAQNPLHRSAVNGNKIRVRCLLNFGWSDYPVDIPKLIAGHEDDIIKMLRVAKLTRLIKAIWWRRILKKISQSKLSMDPTDVNYATAFEKRRERVASRDVRNDLAWYDKLEENPLFSGSGASIGKTTTDADLDLDKQGMHKLHHYCKNSNFWKAKVTLETISSDTLPKLLTCDDSRGMLPLHYAARNGSQALVELLLKSFKLDPTVLLSWPDQQGQNPLHKAAENGDVDTVWYLLHAHINSKDYVAFLDNSSRTARDLARVHGCAGAEKLLAKTEHHALTE